MFNRSVYITMAMSILVLIGTLGTSLAAGLEDTIATIGALTPTVPTGVATDSFGNLYFADTGGNKVVMTTAAGAVTITIGTGTAGFVPSVGSMGLNTTLADATIQFNAPTGVAVDALGNVYIADTGNHRIHKITADTTTKLIAATSAIKTVAGNGVARYSGDEAAATLAGLKRPTGVAVDATNNIYIADNGNYRIRKVDTTGKITTIAGVGTVTTMAPYNLAFSPAGDLYIADSGNNRILKIAAIKGVLDGKTTPVIVAGTGTAGYSGDGGLATLALLNQPSGVATDGTDLYISDTMNNCIRKISLITGVISTRAGSAVQAAINAVLSNPTGIALDSAGDVFFADSSNNLIKEVYASISAITTASPPGGIYKTTQIVSLTPSRAATISYKINADAWTPYSGAIFISGPGATTLSFKSTDTTALPEVVNTAIYTFDNLAPTTTATISATPTSVNGTTYYTAQPALTVSLTSNDPFSSVFYTTTGIVPTTASAKYTGTISIPVTSTLTTTDVQFFAMDAVGNKEVVQSKKYLIATINTAASPAGGIYTSARTVTLASNDSTAGNICYTTTGVDPVSPCPGPSVYTAPLVMAADTVLKFRAVDKDGNFEQIKTQTYTIDNIVPITTASPAGSVVVSFITPQAVTLTANEQNATIYYTTTGLAPTTASTKYTVPIVMPTNKTTTLMFLAVDQAGNQEVVKTQVYIIDTVAPTTTASVQSGTFASIKTTALTADDPKATIYFTTDGTTPTVSLVDKYTTPILINKTTTLKYFAVDVAGNVEPVKRQDYTFITLATTASPKGGTFTAFQEVSLAANGVGATIYYTTDGTTPTAISKKYTSPIMMTNAKTTLQFYQVDAAGIKEPAKAEIYTVDAVAPTTTIICGTTANTITLTVTDNTDPLPKIKYITNSATTFTRNGSTVNVPAYTMTDYTSFITFANNAIVKAFAVDAAGNTEQIKTAYCNEKVATAPAVVVDPNPSLYLETLPNAATTANTNLYINGNVGPFDTTTLGIKKGAGSTVVVSTSTADGSFSYKMNDATSVTTFSLAVANTYTTTATNVASVTADTRTITQGGAMTPTTLTIGSRNGVIGHDVRVPIIFSSGYQAAALSIDIAYDTSRLTNPGAEIGNAAAASGKIISGRITAPGVYRILIIDSPSATTIKAMPDGEVAYLSFSMLSSVATGAGALAINSYSVTDLDATVMPVPAGANGAVNVVSKPGNTGATDTAVDLKGVLGALYMLLDLDPVTYPVDCQVDMNADGVVQINELQQVINSFLGM